MNNLQRAVLPGSDDREDEDTIEMQLSPAQYEVLVRAAVPAEPEPAGAAVAAAAAGAAATVAAPASAAAMTAAASAPTAAVATPAAATAVIVTAPSAASAVTVAAPVANELASAAIKQAIAAIDPVPAPRALTAAARETPPPAPRQIEVSVHALPAAPPSPRSRRSAVMYVFATAGVILLVVAVTIAYQLGARTRPTDTAPSAAPAQITAPVKDDTSPAPTPPAIQRAPTLPPPPALIEDAAARPVRFRNPFDSNEVFEFPPGTPYTEARDAVAAKLLKRAQERQTAAPRPKADDPSFAQRT
jgi:hypothetical protein